MKQLCAEKQIEIRFSEVDIMNVVWHGSYPLYFEDAREAFGKKYDLAYQRYIDEKVFAPIVELNIKYRRPLTYGMKPIVRITYVPTEAAKVIFDYEIVDPDDGTVFVTARSIQVFMNQQYQLLWDNPEFYRLWKERWL
ncbi:MAG: acyl-CoA thioesterase [Bacteroidaceae bacterium]|jgi:acyl-CoA thioester hydrolase|nr:acyl-CoA thioesterase [Bacteroidaceae bacterium]